MEKAGVAQQPKLSYSRWRPKALKAMLPPGSTHWQPSRARRAQNLGHISHLITVIVSPNRALESLRMARKLDRFGETPRMALEPWIVEAALARLGKSRFTRGEQEAIVRATRTPRKVRWPPWWEMMP